MLIAYDVAIELVHALRPLVTQIRKHDSTLAKQLVDAMSSSVSLAVAAALPSSAT